MTAQPTLTAEPKLSNDFHRLWAAFTVSQLGSSLSAGALPLIAILVLGIAWSISSRSCQPAFIALGGALATVTSVRFAIGCAAVALLTSSFLLPWRAWPTRP